MYIDSNEYGLKKIFVTSINSKLSPEMASGFKKTAHGLRELVRSAIKLSNEVENHVKYNGNAIEVIPTEKDLCVIVESAKLDTCKVGILLMPEIQELVICDLAGTILYQIRLPCKVKCTEPMSSYENGVLKIMLEREI
ncbi:hypothetical protein COT30_01595 [Candidatus Micrarchaeota archaeon CG08_land_8_20_14_0_20_49_17]|nr:MAG: hypothetical protein AUJ13_00310 [Candidatus Micrarchaeota archaeon CG1_02_49_24]PIU09994.1 MAG: hypothetical protein COT30_01595 [Candidatus Micrarchaeota archaeon CG08_land_8_20_14_0_20_49_17]HII54075.1 hypothetical protein [Candidatus Micrarchaeota archaeon]